MKEIGEILKNENPIRSLQSQQHVLQRQESGERNLKLKELLKKYQTPDKFCEAYNPDVQHALIKRNYAISTLVFKDVPTLECLQEAYGFNTPVEWLILQLGTLNDFVETKIKMTKAQFRELAVLIICNYSYLNAAEIMFFIARFKAGMYGSFYGAIDPLKITSALQEYVKQRKRSVEEYLRNKEMEEYFAKRDAWSKNAVSYETYLKNESHLLDSQG